MTSEGFDTSDGFDAERATLAAIERLRVPHEILRCEPEFADTAAFCARYGFPPENAGNTIIVASKRPAGRYAACVVLATCRLDVNRAVRDVMGVSKASFASAEEMKALTGMDVGGVTIFALPEGLPIYVDDRVMALDYVILGIGGRRGKIKLAPEVLSRLPNVRVVSQLAREATSDPA
jgi:prolyl-tRNA editing enzyme YbaK/EbsC (Cys-tRNA(Pro) deacylase)